MNLWDQIYFMAMVDNTVLDGCMEGEYLEKSGSQRHTRSIPRGTTTAPSYLDESYRQFEET